MKKNGKNPSGTQRWYCTQCRYSSTRKRVVDQRLLQFKEFLDYVTDTQPLRLATGVSRSTWNRDHAWCWNTRPIWEPTGEVYEQVFIDGTYISYGWCVLTASTIINKKTKVIAYQLCQRENKTAYSALLARIPPPVIVTTNGDRGALAAIKACWPDTRIQRCVVHVQRNIRTVTTTRPKIDQHKALYNLALNLTRVTSIDQVIAWQKALAAFHGLYDTWLAEKTYRHAVPAAQVPKFARNNKTWWYTHHDTRRMVRALDRYVKDGVLFTFLALNLPVSPPLASSTNSLEGVVNSPLKSYLKAHRGWSESHMLTALDYYLYTRSPEPKPLTEFINNRAQPQVSQKPDLDPGPVEIDTHIDLQQPWENGLHIQKGWAGRSN